MLGRLVRCQRGQSLAELSIVLPVLLIVVLGSIDLGRVFFAYISVTNAARNGARYAAAGPESVDDLPGIREAALAETGDLLDTSPTNPEIALTTGTDGVGRNYAEVTVSYDFDCLFPWPGIPSSMNVERSVRAMVAK